MVGTTVTLPEATPRSSSQETAQAQPGLSFPNVQPSAEISQQLLTSTSQSPEAILVQTSPGDAPFPGSPLDPDALNTPPSNTRPPVLAPGESPSLEAPTTPSTLGTPQQFQFTLAQVQTLDRIRTLMGSGNYGRPLESVRLQMATRTNYTQEELNGLGNSLHAMVSGMLIAADLHAQGIDEYSAPGGPRFTVDQLHNGGIGRLMQTLLEAGIPLEPLYVGIRRDQDVAAAPPSTAAPISSTGAPNPTTATPVVADPNAVPQPPTATPAVTTTPADERPQATPALQLVPTSDPVTEEQAGERSTGGDQPVAPAIPRPEAVLAEYRRRLWEGELA